MSITSTRRTFARATSTCDPSTPSLMKSGTGLKGMTLAYQMTGYYRRNRDTATDVTEYLGNGVSLTTKANLPKDNSAGLEFTSNGQILPKLAYSLSGNLFYSQIDATALGAPGLKSTTGVNAKLNWITGRRRKIRRRWP